MDNIIVIVPVVIIYFISASRRHHLKIIMFILIITKQTISLNGERSAYVFYFLSEIKSLNLYNHNIKQIILLNIYNCP